MFNRDNRIIGAALGISLALSIAIWNVVPNARSQVISPSTGPAQSGSVSAGDCVQWGPGIGQISSAGGACGGTAGSIVLNQNSILVGNASNVATGVAMSGDCSVVSNGAITCTKTNGVAYAASATTDTTVGTNISSGTVANARLTSAVVAGVTNDTNVTGSIAAQNLTLGWTGTLGVARGGTGAGTFTADAVVSGNGTSALQASRLTVNTNGHLSTSQAGSTTVGSCGTSPALTAGSRDAYGRITTGSTATTACTLTFAVAYGTVPYCVATGGSSSLGTITALAGTTTLALTYSSSTSALIYYVCFGD